MRPASLRLFPAAIVLATLLPRGGSAQTIPSPYAFIEEKQEIGLFVGTTDVARGRFGFGPAGGTAFGARYGLQLSGPLALEGVAGVTKGKRAVIDPRRDEDDRVIGEGDVLMTTIEARLRLSLTGDRSWHRLSPFFAFGGGIAFDTAEPADADDLLDPADVFEFGTSFYTSLGIGARYFLTRRVALRADGTFSLWKIDTPPGFGTYGFGIVEEGEWTRGLGASITLLYRW